MEITRNEIESLIYDPARIQSRILNFIEESTNGDFVVADATNPFTMLLESAITTSSAAALECNRLLRKKYPSLALTKDELIHHLSDDELANMFAVPAETTILFYINVVDMRMHGFRPADQNYWELKIPIGTTVTILDTKLTLLNTISIKLYDNAAISVEQFVNDNDFAIEDLGILPSQLVTDENGVPFIQFGTRVKQTSMKTYTPSISTSQGFRQKYKLTDQFAYIEVFSVTGNKYYKLDIAYNEEYINPSKPTAYVSFTNGEVLVKIPDVYLTNGMIGKSLIINVYETKGKMYLPIKEFMFDQYVLSYGDTGADLPSSRITQVAVKVNSNGVIDGGSNGLTDTELRESIIYNSTGDVDLPITDWHLSRMTQVQGYEVFKQQDVITNRLYSACKNISKINQEAIKANQDLYFNTANILLRDALNSNTVEDYKDTFVIMSNTLFKEQNSIVTLVSNEERKLLNGLSNAGKIARMANTKYFYTPFYYVIKKADGYTYSNVYHLDTPEILTNRIVNKNVAISPSVNIKARDIIRLTNKSYKLACTLTGNAEYDEIEKEKIKILVGIPLKGDVQAYVEMTYNSVKDQYEVELQHNLDIDDDNYMTLTNGRSLLADKRFNLDCTLNFYIYTTDPNITSNLPFLEDEVDIKDQKYVVFTKETMKINFGKKLDYIWSRLNNTYTDRKYISYEENIYKTYATDVYEKDPVTGSMFFVVDGRVEVRKIHNAGEYVLDDNGNKIIEHKAGDIVLNENNEPTIDVYSGLNRFIDIAMLEAEFRYTTNLAYRNYARLTLDRILEYILVDMPVFNSKLIENTSILYKSYKTCAPINIIINHNKTTMSYKLKPEVTLYSTSTTAYTVEEINEFRDRIGLIIDNYLNNSTIRLSELKTEIMSSLGNSIAGVKIANIDENDSEVIVCKDKINRFSLNKKLVLNDFDELIVVYDVTVNIQYV